MRNVIRVRRFHGGFLDEVLKKGRVQVPLGTGLYFKRLEGLDKIVKVESIRRDVFQVSLTGKAFRHLGESGKYSLFKPTGHRWADYV